MCHGIYKNRRFEILITIEGIDGSGKSTQAKLLAVELESQGYDVVLTKEPGGTEEAFAIREILINNELDSNEQFFLFLASRAIHVRKVIKPALERGAIVICDRYHLSTMVYQHEIYAEIGCTSPLWDMATLGVYPELTFMLDITAPKAIERLKRRGNNNVLDSLDPDILNILRQRFLKWCNTDFGYEDIDNVLMINGQMSEKWVHNTILDHVEIFLKKR